MVRPVDEVKRIALAALLAACVLAPAAARAPRPLVLADLRTLVSYSGVAISPDGRLVAAVEQRRDYTTDKDVPSLVVIDVASHAKRTLTEERDVVASPAWSPSGDRLAFVSLDEKKKPQVFALPMNGGEAHKLTDTENGVSAYAWSPDGKRLAYVTQDTAPNKKAIDAHDDGFLITEQPSTGRSAVLSSHIWIVGDDPKKAKRLTKGSWSTWALTRLEWRPDGRAIAFTWDRDGSFDFYGYTRAAYVDVPSGTVHYFGGNGTESPIYDFSGTHVAYTAPNHIAFLQDDLVIAAANGSNAHDVGARIDRSAGPPTFDASGAALFTAGDGTVVKGYRVRADGSYTNLPIGDAQPGYQSFSAAKNGSLAFSAPTEHDPSEVYVLTSGAARAVALTATNAAIAAHPMGTHRTITWTTPDGYPANAVITEPVGFNPAKTYPLVLYIHGGPTGASTIGFDFLGVPELMAGRGWIVLEPNYRGSNSVGARAIATSIGHPTDWAGKDILESVGLVEKEYHIDRSRIGVSGWSAGGWMTSWMITHDTRWRAAFDGAAVDSVENVATIGDIDNYANILIGGDPWASQGAWERMLESSPQTYWSRVKTKTLIVTDAGDQRVPTPTSYTFYHSLRAAGAPVTLLIYPNSGHFPQDPLHLEDVARRWVDWFATNFSS